MTVICKECGAEVQDKCPRCTPNKTNCWPGKRKARFKTKKAIEIKCSFSSNNP